MDVRRKCSVLLLSIVALSLLWPVLHALGQRLTCDMDDTDAKVDCLYSVIKALVSKAEEQWQRISDLEAYLTADQTMAKTEYPTRPQFNPFRPKRGLFRRRGSRGPPGPSGPRGYPGTRGPTGPKGPTGSRGSTGPRGATGPQGIKGSTGARGYTGPPGLKGSTGTRGLTGIKGSIGSRGHTGPQGLKGSIGPRGSTGPQGIKGKTGLSGPTGSQGIKGSTGPRGPTGPGGLKGSAGPHGTSGPPGSKGSTGSPGAAGPIGPSGPPGPRGANGSSGTNGADGLQGPSGVPGTVGKTGLPGPKGGVGPSGSQGTVGPTGPVGPTGLPGLAGADGTSGSKGERGDPGIGVKGPKGDSGLAGPPGNTGASGNKGDQGDPGTMAKSPMGGPGLPRTDSLSEKAGVTYVRWGRTSCPSDINTSLVYSGSVGGSRKHPEGTTGSGSNYLCLPNDPEWNNYTDTCEYDRANIYGVEYRNSDEANEFQAAPCTVCLAVSRSSILMTPGKMTCPVGWTIEYSGYLMAKQYSYVTSSEYVCVDEDQEVVPGVKKYTFGGAFFKTEAVCGTLLCPPYVNGRELTCVVCTK